MTKQPKILGFTYAQIDKATCYLTPKGMKLLNPCSWALYWMEKRGKQKVDLKLFKRWISREPDCWLCNHLDYFGPPQQWGWDPIGKAFIQTGDCLNRVSMGDICIPSKKLVRYLKAYIMKHGKKE